MLNSFIIFPLLWGLGQAHAHETRDGRVHVSLGSLTYQTQYENDRDEVEAPIQGSLGLVVNGDVGEFGSLEVGMFYLDKLFLRELNNEVLVEKIKRLYMTIGYRRWVTDRFGIGLSAFTSYSMGDPDRIHSTSGGDPGFQTSAHDTSDHGVDASFLYEFYKKDGNIGVIDLRSSYSLSPREDEDGNHLALFIAFKKRTR